MASLEPLATFDVRRALQAQKKIGMSTSDVSNITIVPSFCRDSYHRWCQILQCLQIDLHSQIEGNSLGARSMYNQVYSCIFHVDIICLCFSSYPFAPICCFSMFLVAFHAIPGASRHLAGWRSSQKASALTQFSWNLLVQELRRLCEKIVTCLQLRFKMACSVTIPIACFGSSIENIHVHGESSTGFEQRDQLGTAAQARECLGYFGESAQCLPSVGFLNISIYISFFHCSSLTRMIQND